MSELLGRDDEKKRRKKLKWREPGCESCCVLRLTFRQVKQNHARPHPRRSELIQRRVEGARKDVKKGKRQLDI
jgi:hypothetical protein